MSTTLRVLSTHAFNLPRSYSAQDQGDTIAEYRDMRVGTPEHRDLFCRTFMEGHRAYEPEQLPWPHLEQKYLDRLRAIPFWSIARAMEKKAGIMVANFADTLRDPLIREAVALQGVEETRHGRIMQVMIDRYQLPATELPVEAAGSSKDEFVVFGYEECVDFFMGAGLFSLARKIEIFPAALTDIFEEILIEEARHVTFFVNWYRYEEARAGRDGTIERHITALKNYVRSLRQLVSSFSGVETTGFAAAQAKDVVEGITPMMFLEAGIAESNRMLALLDPRLIKPGVLPTLAHTLLALLRAIPPRTVPITRSAPNATVALNGSRDHSVAA